MYINTCWHIQQQTRVLEHAHPSWLVASELRNLSHLTWKVDDLMTSQPGKLILQACAWLQNKDTRLIAWLMSQLTPFTSIWYGKQENLASFQVKKMYSFKISNLCSQNLDNRAMGAIRMFYMHNSSDDWFDVPLPEWGIWREWQCQQLSQFVSIPVPPHPCNSAQTSASLSRDRWRMILSNSSTQVPFY